MADDLSADTSNGQRICGELIYICSGMMLWSSSTAASRFDLEIATPPEHTRQTPKMNPSKTYSENLLLKDSMCKVVFARQKVIKFRQDQAVD
jgi:hypothetical protein